MWRKNGGSCRRYSNKQQTCRISFMPCYTLNMLRVSYKIVPFVGLLLLCIMGEEHRFLACDMRWNTRTHLLLSSALLCSSLLCSAVAYMTYRSINHFSSGSHTHRTHTRQTIALMLARQHWLCRYIGNVLCLCFVMWYQFRKRPKRGTCTSLILQYSVGCAQNCRPFSIWFINNLAEIILRYWTKCYEEMSEINHFRSIVDKCWGFMKLTHLFFAKRNQSELDVVDWIVIHFG